MKATPAMSDVQGGAKTVLIFDSGFGGLSVFQHLREALPSCNHVYVADDVGFPYGDWEEGALIDHCARTMATLIERFKPDIAVIACNTASTALSPVLRKAHDIEFVGTVPAIKPATNLSKNGMISVLATPGTVKRDYTQALIDTFATHQDITLVGSPHLAALADQHMAGEPIDEDDIFREILPCFQEQDERRTDVIVLACTHYPLLLGLFEKLAPWPVTFVDSGSAIARRVADLLPTFDGEARAPRFEFTSSAEFPSGLVARYSA